MGRRGDRVAGPALALLLVGSASRAEDPGGVPARIVLAGGETLAVRFHGATGDGGLRYSRPDDRGGGGETFWEEVAWLRLGDSPPVADPLVAVAALRVLLRDGTVLAALRVEGEGEGGALRLDEPDLGPIRLPAESVVWIRLGEGPLPPRPKGLGRVAAPILPASGVKLAVGAAIFYPPSPPVPRARATAFWAKLRGGSALRTAAPRDARPGVAEMRTPLLGLRQVPWSRVSEVRAVPPRATDRVLAVEFGRGLAREFGPTREPEWSAGVQGLLLDAEVLPEGGLLLTDRAGGRVIEVSALGDEVWAIEAEDPVSATRFPGGNTAVTRFRLGGEQNPVPLSGAVTEVTPAGESVWSLERLDCPTEADLLPGGEMLVCETAWDSGDPARKRVTIRARDGSILSRWGGFRYPADAEALPDGGVVVADRDDPRVVFLDRDGTVRRTIGGPGARVPLSLPFDVDLLADGSVLIADSARGPGGGTGRVLRVSPDDRVLWSLSGLADPIEVEAR
ncbi:MAG: hypothetical protein L0216_20280 [Planctomycetales bacterium]|nr:hypothetical protein [Planctomycetales bacterium]